MYILPMRLLNFMYQGYNKENEFSSQILFYSFCIFFSHKTYKIFGTYEKNKKFGN